MEASPTERAFRKVESELDELLAAALPALTVKGLAFSDRSTRTYNYKESYLRWEVVFERQWHRDLFTRQAQVTLSYGEPIDPRETPRVGVFRRAESFRQGQVSSIDDKFEDSCPLEDVRVEGIAKVVEANLAVANLARCHSVNEAEVGPLPTRSGPWREGWIMENNE